MNRTDEQQDARQDIYGEYQVLFDHISGATVKVHYEVSMEELDAINVVREIAESTAVFPEVTSTTGS